MVYRDHVQNIIQKLKRLRHIWQNERRNWWTMCKIWTNQLMRGQTNAWSSFKMLSSDNFMSTNQTWYKTQSRKKKQYSTLASQSNCSRILLYKLHLQVVGYLQPPLLVSSCLFQVREICQGVSIKSRRTLVTIR